MSIHPNKVRWQRDSDDHYSSRLGSVFRGADDRWHFQPLGGHINTEYDYKNWKGAARHLELDAGVRSKLWKGS